MAAAVILQPDHLLPGPEPESLSSGPAVLVEAGRIVAIGTAADLAARSPAAKLEALPGCILMPGFVNAHQHGRSLTAIQLGQSDDILEVWIVARRRRGAPDLYPLALMAAADMLANGVTTAIHANTSYGTGDYETEIRSVLRGYDESGLRVMTCVGAQDRGMIVYPDEDVPAFLASLPPALRRVIDAPAPQPYMGGLDGTLGLMDRLSADFAGHPRLSLAYGPAGPQWITDDHLRGIGRDAERRGLPIQMHALESKAQSVVCGKLFPDGLMRHLERMGVVSERLSLAHGVFLTPDDVALGAKAGVTVVRNAGSNLRLRNGMPPLRRYLDGGLRVAIGSDSCSLQEDEDLLAELRLAAGLARGADFHGSERPTSADQLAMIGVNGAAAAGLTGQIGRIVPGAKADLVAVSLERATGPYTDAATGPVPLMLARAGGRDVRMTMVDGEILYRDGRFTRFDMATVLDAARATLKATEEPFSAEMAALLPELQVALRKHYAELTGETAQ